MNLIVRLSAFSARLRLFKLWRKRVRAYPIVRVSDKRLHVYKTKTFYERKEDKVPRCACVYAVAEVSLMKGDRRGGQ